MDYRGIVLIEAAILLGAIVQGTSGLGFNLTAAPIVNAIMPGPQSVGLINLCALLQNAWMLTRERGRIRWQIFKVLGPALAVGVLIGFGMVRLIPDAVMPILVALSALLSLVTLITWRAGSGVVAGATAGVWSGAINTYAGVGGPPVASYLISQGWPHADFLRTLQLVFIGIDIVSLPILGLPALPWWFYAIAVGCLLVGTGIGSLLRQRLTHDQAVRLSRIVIALAALVSLGYSIVTLMS
ncbi:MAG: sulfite exporter TauE/SafE family protein [Actinomycetota bacterium]